MADQAADMNMADISAALAAVGNAAVEGPGGGSAGAGAGGAGSGSAQGAGARAPSAAPVQSLDFILDIPLKVTVELGRTKMAIRDVLQMAQGSVVELSKFAGEPLEVLVNENLIARGEVVV